MPWAVGYCWQRRCKASRPIRKQHSFPSIYSSQDVHHQWHVITTASLSYDHRFEGKMVYLIKYCYPTNAKYTTVDQQHDSSPNDDCQQQMHIAKQYTTYLLLCVMCCAYIMFVWCVLCMIPSDICADDVYCTQDASFVEKLKVICGRNPLLKAALGIPMGCRMPGVCRRVYTSSITGKQLHCIAPSLQTSCSKCCMHILQAAGSDRCMRPVRKAADSEFDLHSYATPDCICSIQDIWFTTGRGPEPVSLTIDVLADCSANCGFCSVSHQAPLLWLKRQGL